MRLGFVGPSYTTRSSAIADEECVNFYTEMLQSQGTIAPAKAYGGSTAQGQRSCYGTPGTSLHATMPTGPTRGQKEINGRHFGVAGPQFVEFPNATQSALLAIASVQIIVGSHTAVITFTTPLPAWIVTGQAFAFSGMTAYTHLNGVTLTSSNISGQVVTCPCSPLLNSYGPATDSGFGSANGIVVRGAIANDSKRVSFAASPTQVMVVSSGCAYVLNLADNVLTEVTSLLQGTPVQAEYSDGYFIVSVVATTTDVVTGVTTTTTKFQMSSPLDGLTWPGLQVNIVSVFPDNIVSIITNHRELIVAGNRHSQPYANTGSDEVFDVIGGTLIEQGSVSTFSPCRLDNSLFWVSEDERGGRIAWRAEGYTPQRISTYAVEYDLSTYTTAQISQLGTYSYQDSGHTFWVVWIPGAKWTWVYDVGEALWHKRSTGGTPDGGPHVGWNHAYAFGRQIIGDWNSGNFYELSMNYLDDAGTPIRRVRRSPTVSNEMQWLYHPQIVLDFDTGQGPQIPLTDESGNPRAPQAMLRWSDDRGKTWGNEHWVDCGQVGNFRVRAIWRRLGRSRYRVYELVVTDPVAWALVDAYLGNPDGQ